MQNFKYNIPTEIIFGKDQIKHLPESIKKYSSKILLVYGQGSIKKTGLYPQITALLKANQILYKELPNIKPNPRIESVYKGIDICRKNNLDFVLAVGAGSTIDCAKTIAAGYFYQGDSWDFFTKQIKIEKALPIGTVLTLAATGSEMNGNAVITNESTQEKKTIVNFLLRPKFSILDPTLTYSVPASQTAAGIVDIISHVFEQYFSPTKEAFIQDKIAEAILKTCIHYGPLAIKEPTNYEARANLMWAGSLALNGLLGLGKKTDWVTHGIEHEISAIYDLTHGVGLAILTPNWMEYVLNEENAYKFVELARNIWHISDQGKPLVLAKKAITKTRDFFKNIGLPSSLKEVHIDDKHFDKMAEKLTTSHGEYIGGFKKFNKQDIINILSASL